MPTATTAAEWKFTDARVQFAVRQYRPVICGREVIERGSTSARRDGGSTGRRGLALEICPGAELN